MEILDLQGLPIQIGIGGFFGAVVVYQISALKQARNIYTPSARGAVFATGQFLRDGGRFLRSQRGGGVYIWNLYLWKPQFGPQYKLMIVLTIDEL